MRLNCFLFLLLLSLFLQTCLSAKKCRAISLAGGGSRGSFQAGALKGLIENLEAEETQWEVITGVSVGSLNGIGLAVFPIGEEEAAKDWAINLWSTITKEDIFTDWKWGIASAVFYQAGLFDNTPLKQFLLKVLQPFQTIHRKYSVGLCDANNGDFIAAQLNGMSIPEAIEFILTSCAMPAVFNPMLLDGQTLIDGGTVVNLDVVSVVNQCREIVDNDEDIILDVILNFNATMEVANMTDAVAMNMFFRADHFAKRVKEFYYLYDGMRAFPNVHWRYIICPQVKLPGENFITKLVPLDFDREHLRETMDIGEKTAKEVIAKYPNENNREQFMELLKKDYKFEPNRIKNSNELHFLNKN